MPDCRRAVFEAVKDRLPAGYSFDQFTAKLHKYAFLPVVVGGVVVGAIMQHANEVHAAVLPEAKGRWYTKTVDRWLATQLAEHGTLTTKVLDGHEAGHIFAKRLGFKAVDHVGSTTIYEKAQA